MKSEQIGSYKLADNFMLSVTMGHGVYVRNYSIFVSDLHCEVDWMDLI
jgi:hypothetical protein